LAPAGTWERAETLAWLSFVAADLHKAYSPLFGIDRVYKSDAAKTEVRAFAMGNVQKHLAHVNAHLAQHEFLSGKHFTIADAYLFVVASWSQWVGVDMSEHTHLQAYLTRVASRPAVQRVLKAEGLLD
jgi:glutathione S-transferase